MFALALGALLIGCSTPVRPGDRARVAFDEIVVSLPLHGAEAANHNLHVGLSVIINFRDPKQEKARRALVALVGASYGPEDPTFELKGILRRIEPRITTRLSEVLSGLGEQSLSAAPALRQRILTEAQPMVDEALRQWKYGIYYRGDVLIESVYWTDASVGRLETWRSIDSE